MAMMVHPDKNNSVAVEGAFKLILDAWNVLSNESTRMGYDLRSGRDIIKKKTGRSSSTSSRTEFGNKFYPKCLIMPCRIQIINKCSSIRCKNCCKRFIFIRRS
ncbi:DnaJ domain [Macleaya cordata]|uniref:DnaJ domain n=1 Tax=Macleaya cordata TaxID=56857 RepID=A0A200QX72_MACCD|nr:DnaJ domain [Macleaya cordata]